MQCCGGKGKKVEDANASGIDVKKLDHILEKYRSVPGSLITVLQEAQEIYGYLSMKVLHYIAEQTNTKLAKVYGVATFYTQFRLKPIGKYLIMLCQGTACHVNGAKSVEAALCDELGIREGETTEDLLFTLNNVACLGCCSLSPVMMVNGETYGNLTPTKARELIKELRNKHMESKGA
ncbi:NADH-quinone oxidoreductase subunit NuoE [Geosporobacter ferrireducens]|uniref:NADH dehydrogenase n=1 Tax=Geosporobacter ferrireducens TaxID=1424294 RepID=A0A1D8GL21_9FIRM|nr:NADH-quinone oxidoreductase subunit NuoE [Geosporobacter ferrireducens]AOT71597.1 NADH dehydrogenase [Geosporobacter ferrireducens]